jgi:hypothetical protein
LNTAGFLNTEEMNNLEILLNLLIRPNYALRRGDKSLSLSVIVIIVAVWSFTVSNYLVSRISVNAAALSFSIIFAIIITLFLIFIAVSLWHFVSESFKGEGKVNELFPCICLSFLPYIFLTPMALIMRFSEGGIIPYWSLFRFLMVVWVITLQILSLKTVYELNGPLATLAYFVPFLIVFAIFLLMFVLIMAFFIVMTSHALTPLLNL